MLSGERERGSSQSFLFKMCSESWACGFCTTCSCDDKGSDCIPVSPGWMFSIARGLVPACLGKNTPGPADFPFAWILGRAKRCEAKGATEERNQTQNKVIFGRAERLKK